MGGTPAPTLNGKSAKLFQNFFFLKGLKNMLFYQIRLKMDKKVHIIDQKALKMYVKRQKMQFWDLKYLLLSEIFLSGIGGYPPPPLNGKNQLCSF